MVKGFNEFINERFEEWGPEKEGNFFQRTGKKISRLFNPEPEFGEENPFQTASDIALAIAGGMADLKFNRKLRLVGGWVTINGRDMSLVIDRDRNEVLLNGKALDLPDEDRVEELYQAAMEKAQRSGLD